MAKKTINLTVRDASSNELDEVYLMGEDVWSEGTPREQYLEGCRNSPKYQSGIFKVLTDGKNLLSSLITYDLKDQKIGIGSIATPKSERKKGYGSEITSAVTESCFKSGAKHVFLYSDIDAKFYEKIGFQQLPDSFQKYPGSVCMVKSNQNDKIWEEVGFEPPPYF